MDAAGHANAAYRLLVAAPEGNAGADTGTGPQPAKGEEDHEDDHIA